MTSYLLLAGLTALWLGGAVYCVLALWAASRFRSAPQETEEFTPFVSLLKPLSGLERDLEGNLGTFFFQNYPSYEILFAVSDASDPALPVLERLRRRYPRVPVKVVETGASPYPNAKVYSLEKMAEMARADLLVISDSDVFVGADYLRAVVRPFASSQVGVTTCVYRGTPGRSLWSQLEALAMSTEFMAGVLVAWALDGMKFALGPTMAVRRSCLAAIGGFSSMAQYLADDFILGSWIARAGYRVVLSSYVVNHQVLGESFRATFEHRLRWARSARRSRPWGYVGAGFTHPLPVAIGLLILTRYSLLAVTLVAVTLALRWLVTWQVAWGVLRDPGMLRRWWMVPLQDLLSFVVWCAGFTGRQIMWRGTAYTVGQDGRFEPVTPPTLGPVAEHELSAAGRHHVSAAGGK